MSGKYKLTYFPLAGKGEAIRLILHAAKQPFEDYRLPFEEWPKLKATIPGGQLPALETPETKPGAPMTQSIAIARYLAIKFNFYPKDQMKMYQVERAVELMKDITDEIMKFFMNRDPAQKEKLSKEYEDGKFVTHMQEMKRFLDENGGPFFIGSELSLADFVLLGLLMNAEWAMGSKAIDKYPFLRSHTEAIKKKSPEVAKYLDSQSKH